MLVCLKISENLGVGLFQRSKCLTNSGIHTLHIHASIPCTNNENSYSLFKYEKENLSGKYKLHVAITTESEFTITLKFREFLQVSLLQDNLRKH